MNFKYYIYMIFVVIIIFTIYYFWTDLNNLYNTGADFAEGFTSYSKVGDNFCVDYAQKDLLQTKWSNGQSNREACMQECNAQGEKCSAMEWYDSGWNGSKCHLILDKDGQGSATTFKQGNRWQDAECYIKPCTPHLRPGRPGEKMHGPWFGHGDQDVKHVYDDCCNGGIAISEDQQYKKLVKFDKDGNSVSDSGRYHTTSEKYNWPTSREQLVEWWNTGSDAKSNYLFKKGSNWTSTCNLVDVKVGPSSQAIGKSKTVSLPVSCPSFLLDSTKPTNQQFPTAVKNTQDPNWGDTFKLDVKDKDLTVTRTDTDGWWGQDLVLVAKKDGKGCKPVVQPVEHDATFTRGAETYGPEHTFTADGKTINSRHFITQGHCNPKGKDATNLEEQGASFCKSIYGDKYNLISDPRTQNLKDEGFGKKYPKIHVGRTKDGEWKTSECTTQGYNIANSICDGKKCKIGDWSEYTSGITNVICSTKPKELEQAPAFEEPPIQHTLPQDKSDQICFNPNTVQKGKKLMEKAQPYLNKSFCLDGSLLGEAANVAKEDLIAAFGAAAPDIQLAQPHLDKAQPHLEAAFEKAGPHLDNAMKKAEPQIKQSIFEKDQAQKQAADKTQQPEKTQQPASAKERANDIVIPPNGDCPNGCQKPQWDNTLCTNEIVDGKEYRKCPWTSQDQNVSCAQCGALLIPKNDYGYARATVEKTTVQNQSIKSQNGTNLNQSSTLNSIQQDTNKDYVAIGKLFMVDLSIQKKITLPPITNQEYANLGQLLHKYELDKTHKQQLTTTVNNILNANVFPSSIDKNNSLLSNLEEELDANNFYAPNLPSSAALKEAQSDNRLGGLKNRI